MPLSRHSSFDLLAPELKENIVSIVIKDYFRAIFMGTLNYWGLYWKGEPFSIAFRKGDISLTISLTVFVHKLTLYFLSCLADQICVLTQVCHSLRNITRHILVDLMPKAIIKNAPGE